MTTPPITDPRLLKSLLGGGLSTPLETIDSAPLTGTIESPLTSMIAAPSAPGPMLGSSILQPSVNPTQTQRDTTLRNKYINEGSGVDQIKNPLLKGLARAGDIAASVFAPGAASFIPGTTLHHNMLVNQATRNVEKDQAQEKNVADISGQQATTRHINDEAASMEAPKSPQYEYIDTPQGKVAVLKGTTEATPITVDGKPITPTEKPKSIEEQAYDFAVKSGKNPLDAYSAVYGARNVKDAGLPQQYLDAISSGDTTKAKLIKQVINDTSTAPKIQVIQAAAASRPSAAAIDTDNPAMQSALHSIAAGDTKLSDVFGRGTSTEQKAQIVAAVKAINPNYNSGDHDIENSARRYMISGAGGQTLNAINTAHHHLDNFDKAAGALQNGDTKALNQIANELGVQVQNGASPQVEFDLVKTALKGEMARAFTGAGATVDEQHALDVSFNNANSYKTMLGVTKQARSLLQGKEKALHGQLEQGKKGQANFGALDGGSQGAATHRYNPATGKIEVVK